MKFRRTLVVAVAAAVTTPVALVAATPAFADSPAASQTETQTKKQPTYQELEKAAAEAKKAYEKALAEKERLLNVLKVTLEADTHPLKAAWLTADKAAKEASAARTAAEKAVEDAQTKLDTAENETEEATAQKALDQAKEALPKAVKAEETAKAEAKTARTALDDARVAAAREYHLNGQALKEADKAKKAADQALAEAKKCVREAGITALADGLPSKVTAGTTVEFTLRLTNGTDRTLKAKPLVAILPTDAKNHHLKMQWSAGSGWKDLKPDNPNYLTLDKAIEPGVSAVKIRLRVGSESPAGDAFALFAVSGSDQYNPCVRGPMKRYDFELLPAGSEPGPIDDAEPGKPDKGDDQWPDTEKPDADKGSSKQPAADTEHGNGNSTDASPSPSTGTDADTDADGNLAKTGASSSTTPIALAGAAAVALGAGAVLVVRRRKATAAN